MFFRQDLYCNRIATPETALLLLSCLQNFGIKPKIRGALGIDGEKDQKEKCGSEVGDYPNEA